MIRKRTGFFWFITILIGFMIFGYIICAIHTKDAVYIKWIIGLTIAEIIFIIILRKRVKFNKKIDKAIEKLAEK